MLRIGVLGAAKITANALFAPVADSSSAEVVAIAARSRSRAKAQAQEWSIPHVEDDYAAVIARDDVDAIFVPLAINLHHEWTLAALAAGKHVLCEKPLASNAAQAQEMVDAAAAADRVLMEAFHWRYHPIAARMAELAGAIGGVMRVDAVFCAPIPETDEVRRSWELSGGALMDLGCYPLQWARFLVGEEPSNVSATMTPCTTAGRELVDETSVIDLEFPGGASATLTTSMDRFEVNLRAEGPDGWFTVSNPLAPHRGHVVEYDLGAGPRQETVGGRSTYHHQLDAFIAAVEDGVVPLTGGVDSVATMTVIDEAYRSAGLPPRGT